MHAVFVVGRAQDIKGFALFVASQSVLMQARCIVTSEKVFHKDIVLAMTPEHH